jgi:hypothetical protein
MNITSVSSAIAPTVASILQPTSPASGSDQDGDGGGSGRVHHGKGGGHMSSAIAQALQSLGLTLPVNGTAAPGSTSPSVNSTDATGTSDTSKVKDDMRQFMHQLFEAVKGEGSAAASSSSSGASTSGDAQSGFAAGLSALLSQVSSGTAPAGLQSAFAQISSDLSPAGAATSSSTSDSGSQATLQAFLTNLQQELGYGQSGGSASGTLLATQV